MLPIPAGTSFSTWAEKWLKEIKVDMDSVLKDDQVVELRERNERLSSYLGSMQVILVTYKTKIDADAMVYTRANPPPDKVGIRAWEAERDASLGELLRTYDFITKLYDVVSKRASIAQSTMRSRTAEASTLS
jgi:hypothetical protein